MARKKIIAGNWKMNKTPSEAVELVNLLKDLVKNDDVDVVYCVPAIDIVPVVEATKGTNVAVGAENMYFEESGAYTGEISAKQCLLMLVLSTLSSDIQSVVITLRRMMFFSTRRLRRHLRLVSHLFFAVVSHLSRESSVLLWTGSVFRSSQISLA